MASIDDTIRENARCPKFALALGEDDWHAERSSRALLEDALRERATDIHLDPLAAEVRVRFRVDGALQDIASLPLDRGAKLIRCFKARTALDPAPSLLPRDGHWRFELDEPEGGTVDVRAACAPCVGGEKLVLRILRGSRVRLRLAELGLREDQRDRIERWLGDINGMFLVAGPTGSGKTTTLYALLTAMHLTSRSIVTIEDPIEYQIDGISQMQVDAKRGLTFAEGLRSMVRLDPDYILMGEIRDEESAAAAVEASNSGHILLSTMHSRDAAGVVTMLRSLGIANHAIAAALSFVVSERLVRKLCPHCRQRAKPTDGDVRWLRVLDRAVPDTVWRAAGCERCRRSGYLGRTGVFQVWPVEEASYDLILRGGDEHALRDHLHETGVRSLLEGGLEKAEAGITDLAELRTIGIQAFRERKEER